MIQIFFTTVHVRQNRKSFRYLETSSSLIERQFSSNAHCREGKRRNCNSMSLCSSSVSITRSGNSNSENETRNQLKISCCVAQLSASGGRCIMPYPSLPRSPSSLPFTLLSNVLNLGLFSVWGNRRCERTFFSCSSRWSLTEANATANFMHFHWLKLNLTISPKSNHLSREQL